MKFYSQFFTLLLILIIITGCGASHRVEAPPRHLRTETYYDQSKKSLKSIEITNPSINGRHLTVDILEHYGVPEYKYDIIEKKSRYRKDPSLIGIINLVNPLAYLIAIGTGKMKAIYSKSNPPFGTFGKWNSREIKKNYQATGKNNILNKMAFRNYNIIATLSGYNTEAKRKVHLKETLISNKGHVNINMGEFAEKLPERPDSLQVNVTTQTKLGNVERNISFSADQLVSMNLSSKTWEQNERERSLPVDIRQDMYAKSLLKALKSEKYEEAVLYSEKLQNLGIDLPGSFNFFHGKSLFKIGRFKDAYPKLVSYTKKAGRNGRYYKQALEILNEVNKKM